MSSEPFSAEPLTPGTGKSGPPWRFALAELLLMVTLVGFALGFLLRAAEEPQLRFFAIISIVASIALVIHVLTRASELTVAAAIVLILFFGCCLWPHGHSPEPSRRMQCSNHLKQIALALQNYHDYFHCFPPAYIADQNGKPIHSWRVLILPFLEEKELYSRYRFDEPWDGPNNRKLHRKIVSVYCCPSRPRRQSQLETSYVAVVGPQTMWPGSKSTSAKDLSDGSTNTIMVVETSDSGHHWMEPRDLDFATMPPLINSHWGPSISSTHPRVALVVCADGHSQALANDTPQDTIKAMLTAAGGEPIQDF